MLTPDHLQSRVNTAGRMLAYGGQPVAVLLGGSLATILPIRIAFGLITIFVIAGAVLAGWSCRESVHLPHSRYQLRRLTYGALHGWLRARAVASRRSARGWFLTRTVCTEGPGNRFVRCDQPGVRSRDAATTWWDPRCPAGRRRPQALFRSHNFGWFMY